MFGWLGRMFGGESDEILFQVPSAPETAADEQVDVQESFKEAYGATVDADDDQWRKLTGDKNRDLAPMTQYRMQDLSVYLWESNLLANRLVELPLAYLLAEGVRLSADDEIVQEWLNEFWNDPINNMALKLIQKARELSLFGEQCWPTFVNEFNGHVRLGYLDPSLIETIVTDPDNGEQVIGVVTTKDKRGHARRYRVIVNGSEEQLFTKRTQGIRESFDDGECFYFAINKLSNGKRGRSDLLPQIDWLDAYENFMFGEIDRAQFMRAFMWVLTMTGATPDEVKEKARTVTPPKPNSVRVSNDAEQWDTVSPDLQTGDSDTAARLFRNHILSGATIPEHWFGGGGDVNRATAAEMGDPTFKVMAMRQTFLGYVLESVAKYVIRQKELAHNRREPDMNDEIYQVNIEWPEMVSSDISKYAAALQQVTQSAAQLVMNHLVTKERAVMMIEKITARLGVEFDTAKELEDALKEAANDAEKDVFKDPPEKKEAQNDDALEDAA